MTVLRRDMTLPAAAAVFVFCGLIAVDASAGSSMASTVPTMWRGPALENPPSPPRTVRYAQAKSQTDSRRRYQWLFGRQEEEPAPSVESTLVLEEFDKEVKQARRLYISGEVDKSILKYRTAIDRLESLIDVVPPGHPLLPELARRFQVFEELATKILGPVDSEPKEELAGEIFHLMEKRRTWNTQVILKKAGSASFFDVPAALLKEEAQILTELGALKSEALLAGTRQKEETLRTRLAKIRDSLGTSSPRYALFRRGTPIPLSELRKDMLRQGEMILDFNLFRDRLLVGFISSDKAIYRQVAAHRSEIDKGVFNLQEKLREFTFSGRSTFMGHAWKEPCRRVYRSLLGKLPPLPDDISLIFVVPDRSMWYLPLSILLDPEDRPFGGDRLVSVIPSASMLRFARSNLKKVGDTRSSSGLAVFESLPLASDDSSGADPSQGRSRKKKSEKMSEGERIEQIILSTSVYPRPSEAVLRLQKVFRKADVSIGPAATIDHLLQSRDRAGDVTLMAVPFYMTDTVGVDRQPCLYFSPDKKGTRRFNIGRLFEVPLESKLVAMPNSWFDVPDSETPIAEGPVLLSTALLYTGTPMALVNYSNPDWGSEDAFLLGVMEKIARGDAPGKVLSEYGRKMPAGLDSSFSGKPPAWSGWILLGDPAN